MAETQKQKAIVLVSGGPDSATLIAWTLQEGFEPTLLNFQFGLRTDKLELRAGRAVAKHFGLPIDVIDIGDAVAMLGMLRPTIHSEAHVLRFGSAILLSIASAYAILKDAKKVFVALHAQDAAESPEYQPPFLQAIQTALSIARGTDDISIEAPFIEMSKTEVLRLGSSLQVPLHLTWSCIVGSTIHCGGCGACHARRAAFEAAGMPDRTRYRA
jgi:7-cyano-7-deazaguanine synthase